jgi:hypothetical protein
VPAYVVELDTNRECAAGKCSNKTVINTEGESAADYLTIAAGVDLSASLTGVSPVSMELSAQRISDELVGLDVFKLLSAESEIQMSADINLEAELVALEALDKEGLKLVITSDANGQRSGTLVTAAGDKVADVVEQDGKIRINFVDGSFTIL